MGARGRQYSQLQDIPVWIASEVCRNGDLLVSLETECEHLVGQSPAFMPRYEFSSLMNLL
jgi:hypothetical protein